MRVINQKTIIPPQLQNWNREIRSVAFWHWIFHEFPAPTFTRRNEQSNKAQINPADIFTICVCQYDLWHNVVISGKEQHRPVEQNFDICTQRTREVSGEPVDFLAQRLHSLETGSSTGQDTSFHCKTDGIEVMGEEMAKLSVPNRRTHTPHTATTHTYTHTHTHAHTHTHLRLSS